MAFKHGEEIVIVTHDAREICQVISNYYEDTARLQELSIRGQQAFSRVFDVEAPMMRRFRILSGYI